MVHPSAEMESGCIWRDCPIVLPPKDYGDKDDATRIHHRPTAKGSDEKKRVICATPDGHFVIVSYDAFDHWPWRPCEPMATMAEVKTALGRMMWEQRATSKVFNDRGTEVPVRV